MIRKAAVKLAKIPYVRDVLERPTDLGELRKRPTCRMVLGMFLVGFSYLIGWPAVGAFGLLAVYFREPLIVAIGGPVTYGLSHLVFLAGAWLAGAGYVKIITRYLVEIFFRQLLGTRL